MKILTVVGNRPQFIKHGVTARSLRLMGQAAPFRNVVVNTGQHYDAMLSDIFFAELEIEAPSYNLGIGSAHIIDQIARMLTPLREIFEIERPDGLLVYGDTNSTIAASLISGHLGVPVVHVEGGERLYRRVAMPEETNRIVTDHLSDVCLASSRKAVRYLAREGFAPDRLRFVGDPMYDIFKLSGELLRSRKVAMPADYGLSPGDYGICTIHRAENTDDREVSLNLLKALDDASEAILLPAHPRLATRLKAWGWAPRNSLRLVDPLGYFDFQSLLRQSAFVVTDSGGVGREAFFAGRPAIVPLESSAWIEPVEAGLAVMTGRSGERLRDALYSRSSPQNVEPLIEANFGTGNAGARIVYETEACVYRRRTYGEGPWHSVGHFGSLPKAEDSSMLTHSHFRSLVARLSVGDADASALLFDVTYSLNGAAELAEIARDGGVAFAVFLDLAQCGYNPFEEKARLKLLALAEANGLAAINDKQAEELAILFGRKATPLPHLPPPYDGEALCPTDAITELECGRPSIVRIQPWLWDSIAVSPFESRLRVIDSARDQALAALSVALATIP